jgi:hypothetical protein
MGTTLQLAAAEEMPRERAFLLLRYALIIATAYLLLVEKQFIPPRPL